MCICGVCLCVSVCISVCVRNVTVYTFLTVITIKQPQCHNELDVLKTTLLDSEDFNKSLKSSLSVFFSDVANSCNHVHWFVTTYVQITSILWEFVDIMQDNAVVLGQLHGLGVADVQQSCPVEMLLIHLHKIHTQVLKCDEC